MHIWKQLGILKANLGDPHKAADKREIYTVEKITSSSAVILGRIFMLGVSWSLSFAVCAQVLIV